MKTAWAVDLAHPSGDESRGDIYHVEASSFLEAALLALRVAEVQGMLVSAVADTGEPA